MEITSTNKSLNLSQKTLLQHLFEPLADTLMQNTTILGQHNNRLTPEPRTFIKGSTCVVCPLIR